jgi:tripartite-type tricarboxylate transporter receptor subunit TctC
MRILLPVLISLACAAPLAAQPYPTKAISIIVPLAPGGGTDLLARVIADKLRDKLGQPVTVENRSGAAGNIGADAVFKSAPDGHTLLFTQPAPLVVNKALYGKLTFEPEQFVPIALVSLQDIMLAANPKVPANTCRSSSPTRRQIRESSISARAAQAARLTSRRSSSAAWPA